MDFLETFVMDDASTASAKKINWSDPDQFSDDPETSPSLDAPVVPVPAPKTRESLFFYQRLKYAVRGR